jgi:hypothetical protein
MGAADQEGKHSRAMNRCSDPEKSEWGRALHASSELGMEKRCLTCGEYWPADTEFFDACRSSGDGLSLRCLACIKEKCWNYLPQHRTVQRSG